MYQYTVLHSGIASIIVVLRWSSYVPFGHPQEILLYSNFVMLMNDADEDEKYVYLSWCK